MAAKLTIGILSAWVVFACALNVQGPPGGGSQAVYESGTSVEWISSVMLFRLFWLDDTTPFNACRIYEVLGSPEDFPAGIHPSAFQLLDEPHPLPCSRESTGEAGGQFRTVAVDSVSQASGVPRVFLTVVRGERAHAEAYSLSPATGEVAELQVTRFLRIRRPR